MHRCFGFLLQLVYLQDNVDVDQIVGMAFYFAKLGSDVFAYGWSDFQVTSGEINVHCLLLVG
jgi:hypothetical protein